MRYLEFGLAGPGEVCLGRQFMSISEAVLSAFSSATRVCFSCISRETPPCKSEYYRILSVHQSICTYSLKVCMSFDKVQFINNLRNVTSESCCHFWRIPLPFKIHMHCENFVLNETSIYDWECFADLGYTENCRHE